MQPFNENSTMQAKLHPWQLRLEHHGFSHIELDWIAGGIHFNPYEPVSEADVVILSSSWPEALRGVQRMMAIRRWCHVVAPSLLVQWLQSQGWPSDHLHTSYAEDGLQVSLEAYTPIPMLTPKEAIHKGWATFKRPWRTLARVRAHQELPSVQPQIVSIVFPSGKELLHLHCAFHERQDAAKEKEWIQRSANATWCIVGVDYEEQSHAAKQIVQLQSEHVLLSDLVGDYRRLAGLPCALLTPLADNVISKGRLVQIFATQVTHRFNDINLLSS